MPSHKYQRISNLLLKRVREENVGASVRQSALIDWYIRENLGDFEDDSEFLMHVRRARAVIQRLLNVDLELFASPDTSYPDDVQQRILSIRPSTALSENVISSPSPASFPTSSLSALNTSSFGSSNAGPVSSSFSWSESSSMAVVSSSSKVTLSYSSFLVFSAFIFEGLRHLISLNVPGGVRLDALSEWCGLNLCLVKVPDVEPRDLGRVPDLVIKRLVTEMKILFSSNPNHPHDPRAQIVTIPPYSVKRDQ
jgi:hypothetical protein